MRMLIAYLLVVVLSSVALTIGSRLVGTLVALLLAWTSGQVRATIAGLSGGIAGVAAAVTFGYVTFHFMVGPGSFGLGGFLASTIPLAIPIYNDRQHWAQLLAAEGQLPTEARAIAAPITQAAHFSVLGYVAGLLLALLWFLLVQATAT